MLHQLNPEAAVISEFGSELKGFHRELVEKLQLALHARQREDSREARLTCVIPGDLTIAYDITNHQFLAHDTCEFADPGNLCWRKAADCPPKWNEMTKRYDALCCKDGSHRTYLFDCAISPQEEETKDNRSAEDYSKKLYNCELPYHKKSGSGHCSERGQRGSRRADGETDVISEKG